MTIDEIKNQLLIRSAFTVLERASYGSLLIRDRYYLDMLTEIGLFGPSTDGDSYDLAMGYIQWLKENGYKDLLPTIEEANQSFNDSMDSPDS